MSKRMVLALALATCFITGCSTTSFPRSFLLRSINSGFGLKRCMDREPDQFRVNCAKYVGAEPAEIPREAIEGGLMRFAGFREDYEYFDRVVIALQKALREKGTADVFALHPGWQWTAVTYIGKHKHLEFIDTSACAPWNPFNSYVVDLSDVDMPTRE